MRIGRTDRRRRREKDFPRRLRPRLMRERLAI